MNVPFFMSRNSGNFDFPPATAGTTSPSQHVIIDPRVTRQEFVDSQAAILRQQFVNEERRRILDDEYRHYTTAHGSTRRQHHEDQAAANQDLATSAVGARALGSRLRRRVYPHERITESLSNSHRGSVRFNPTTHGAGLSALDLPPSGSPDMATAEYTGEASIRRWKRRKLDDNCSPAGKKGFSYGWKGQVMVGQLKMEIHDCDGGLHAEAAQLGQQYWPQNLLRNDKSVYCTEKSQCNIILRHIGETCFTLKKVVIKAPERGFTAPIQEGMIFVSMDAKDLRKRTSQYRLRSHSIPNIESYYDPVPSSPSENRPLSRRRDSSSRTVPPPISHSMPRSVDHVNDSALETMDWVQFLEYPLDGRLDGSLLPEEPSPGYESTALFPRDSANQPLISQGFGITTHCNDPSSDEEEESSALTLADRYQRENMSAPISSGSDEDAEHALERALRARRWGFPPSYPPGGRIGRRREEPSRIEVAAHEMQHDGKEGMLAPHARFFIEREKSVVSVSFEPPVSGRYILLKLWSPSECQNIDIQSIVAYGFAGPKMFPATQML
ncbi:MAG: hypothetical protein Q9163_001973 [Psora crenata]